MTMTKTMRMTTKLEANPHLLQASLKKVNKKKKIKKSNILKRKLVGQQCLTMPKKMKIKKMMDSIKKKKKKNHPARKKAVRKKRKKRKKSEGIKNPMTMKLLR